MALAADINFRLPDPSQDFLSHSGSRVNCFKIKASQQHINLHNVLLLAEGLKSCTIGVVSNKIQQQNTNKSKRFNLWGIIYCFYHQTDCTVCSDNTGRENPTLFSISLLIWMKNQHRADLRSLMKCAIFFYVHLN